MARRMDKASFFGTMVPFTRGSSKIITSKESDRIIGRTGAFTMANGSTTKCMARESSPGQMGKSTSVNSYPILSAKDNTSKIKRMGKVFTNGMTEENMLELGRTGNSMGKEN
jgi:hypothetical protein